MSKKNSKKIDFDNAVEKVEGISNTVDIIMRNKLIIAILLITDGVTFILNPDTTLPEMAKNIIMLVLLATASILLVNLSAKKKNIKTIVLSIVIIAIGIFFYIYPDLISAYMQLLLALFIIYQGLMNLATSLKLDIISNYTQAIVKKFSKNNKHSKKINEEFKAVDNDVNGGLEQQKDKLMTPLNNIIAKTSKFSILYTIANIATIILGIVLLVFPSVSMAIWGVIFLYTGLQNLFAAAKTMHILKKIKEKKFKEIIFDAGNSKPKQSSSK